MRLPEEEGDEESGRVEVESEAVEEGDEEGEMTDAETPETITHGQPEARHRTSQGRAQKEAP